MQSEQEGLAVTPLDLWGLVRELWHQRWLLAGATLLCAVLAFTLSVLLPRQYEATVVVIPVSGDGGGGGMSALGGLASQFGGLAALAGISLGDRGDKSENLAVLRSNELVREFITQERLLPLLSTPSWARWFGQHTTAAETPSITLWKASREFTRSVLRIDEEKRTGLVRVTMRSSSPQLAADWANDFVSLANSILRERQLGASSRHIEYLTTESKRTDLVAVKAAIDALLESEMKKIMLARGNDEYAFRVVDRAVKPELPVFPIRRVWTMLGALFGLGSAALWIFVRWWVRQPRTSN
jgi:uncharacterized protein involved in exopolysaccharide biosynthesis